MTIIGGLILVLGFLLFLKLFGLVERSKKVITIAKSSMETVRSKVLDDYQKEKAMQKNAKELFVLFFIIALGSLFAVVIPLGVVWVMQYFNIVEVQEVIDLTFSWEFILASIIISGIVFWLWAKKK